MSANSVFVNTKLFDYVNNFSNNYPKCLHLYICSQSKADGTSCTSKT